jgi:ribulose-phosphate 3-epimerase
MQAGVAVNPHTPISFLKDIIADVDVVNLMSVNPGFGGQQFIPHTLTKIRELRTMIDEQGLDVKIEIDGGVTVENAAAILKAGADVLVVGSTVFGSKDPKGTIHTLINTRYA